LRADNDANPALLDKLPRAKDARYAYVDRPKCLEGTRTVVLEKISKWVDNHDGQQVYWLNGVAGTGKTTIALTFADLVANDDGKLSASFFCSRDSDERSDVELIFPTLAFLLSERDAQFRERVIDVITRFPDIGHSLPNEQLRRLIIEPLRETGSPRQPVVLVLDALDECKGDHAPEKILLALARHIHAVPFLRVFVSSRPTSSTNSAFADESLERYRKVFALHDVEKEFVDADIRLFLINRLRRAAHRRRLTSASWPPEDQVEQLVRKAGQLFIFAFTICKYIEYPGDLEDRLSVIANLPTNDHEGRLGIDNLYRDVLEAAIKQFDDAQTLENCCSIVGTVILLQTPLSSKDLGQLLGLKPQYIQNLLSDMHSLLIVPEDIHDTIRTFHASFHDFLTNKKRSLPRMFIQPTSQHRAITLCLLKHMVECMERNMCSLDRFKLNSETDDLAHLTETHFPGSLRYSCRYWADHLVCVSTADSGVEELVEALDKFACTKLLFWIEVLSLLGTLGTAVTALDKARNWHDVCLLYDCKLVYPKPYV